MERSGAQCFVVEVRIFRNEKSALPRPFFAHRSYYRTHDEKKYVTYCTNVTCLLFWKEKIRREPSEKTKKGVLC